MDRKIKLIGTGSPCVVLVFQTSKMACQSSTDITCRFSCVFLCSLQNQNLTLQIEINSHIYLGLLISSNLDSVFPV